MTCAEARALPLVSELTAAIGQEIDARDPLDTIAWPDLPTVGAMVLHSGNVQRWVTAVVRSRTAVDQASVAATAVADSAAWYMEGRAALLETLAAAPPQDPCWVLGKRPGSVGFWRRRMIYENAKHLMDLRAAGGRSWAAAEELSTADYADGLDELFEVFLPRSRPRLTALPTPVVLRPDDTNRRWHIDRDWNITSPTLSPTDITATEISAHTSDLALALWQRADLRDRDRFNITGSSTTVDALASTAIHPW